MAKANSCMGLVVVLSGVVDTLKELQKQINYMLANPSDRQVLIFFACCVAWVGIRCEMDPIL
jgi:dissimilatory sulfite reductase (desulfoviridin) alpha/beta subunit